MGHPSDGPNGAVELDMEMDEIAGIGWALRETMGNHGKPMQICATSGGPTRTGMEPMKLAMEKKAIHMGMPMEIPWKFTPQK